MSQADRTFDVVVVGAGIAGLATAWYLGREAAARGLPVRCTVLEKSGRAGGKIVTESVEAEGRPSAGRLVTGAAERPPEGRFVVEGGPDSFLAAQKPWGVELARELGLSGRLIGTNDKDRTVYVVSRGRPVKLPEGVFMLAPTRLLPFVLSPLISPWGKVRMGLDLLIPRRTDDEDETLGHFVTRRFGAEALDKIAEPLLSGIYSAEVDRQSLLATFPRFREMERERGSLIRAMRAGARRPGQRPASAGQAALPQASPGPRSAFVSFQGGMAELPAELVARLPGGVGYDRPVVGLGRAEDGHGWVVQVETGAGTQDLRVDAVVLAVPAFVSAGLLDPLAPAAARLLNSIRYVSSGTISLGYPEDASWASVFARLRGFGILVPASEKRPVNAITWSSVKFPGRAPSGHSLLRVFFGGSRSPRSMDLDDEELLPVVRRQLREIMGIGEQPLFHRIQRWERGIPQYDVGHLERVAAIEASLPAGVFVTGSAYRGIGVPDCARQAADTARRVIDELGRRGGSSWK